MKIEDNALQRLQLYILIILIIDCHLFYHRENGPWDGTLNNPLLKGSLGA